MNLRVWSICVAMGAAPACDGGDSASSPHQPAPDGGSEVPTICLGGRVKGDYSIAVQDDVDALDGCTSIDGALTIKTIALKSVVLSSLSGVSDRILVASPTLTQISMPALQTIGGDLHIGNNQALVAVDMPRLASIGATTLEEHLLPGELLVQGNGALSTLHLPLLGNVAGRMGIDQNPVLTRIDLPALALVGDDGVFDPGSISVSDNPLLQALRMPALERIGSVLMLDGDPLLETLDVNALRQVGGRVAISHVGLTTLTLPALETTQTGMNDFLWITANPNLETIHLERLAHTSGLSIFENPLLQSVAVPALSELVDKSAPLGGYINFASNPMLAEVTLPALSLVAGTIAFEQCETLANLDLTNLKTVNGGLYVINTKLDRLTLPALTAVGALDIMDNSALTDLDLPVLVDTPSLRINNNPALPPSEAAALHEQTGGQHPYPCGNLGEPRC